MSSKIKVDPAQLKSAASKIEPAADDYRQLFEKLFSDVNGMATAWQGADNIAFTEQIAGFRGDFEKMAVLMDEYAQFLRQAADAYQSTQDDIIAGARRLVN